MGNPLYGLRIVREFAAAHRIAGYRGECANLHGHTWRVEVQLYARSLAALSGDDAAGEVVDGMLVDFRYLKRLIDDILPDHKYLNDEFTFNPTAENLAAHFYYAIATALPLGLKDALHEVVVWESDHAAASYKEARG